MAMSTGNYKNNRKASDVVSLNFALRICKKKFLQELSQPPLWLMASGLSSKTLTKPKPDNIISFFIVFTRVICNPTRTLEKAWLHVVGA